ncbi:CHC2 zinc finger domain-containing protein [Halovulum sp. GXIMD14793]
MPRIAESEIDRLKSDISLLEWVRSEGLEPSKRGKDWVVLCPFHEEDTASCVITPRKNLFNCFGCGAGGTIVDWVMRRRGVSFPHAIEILRTGSSGPVSDAMHGVQHIEPIMPMDVSAQVALREVMDFYHDCLHQTPEVLAFLEKRGIGSPELIKEFRLGYCNRTLGYRLPSKTTKAGVTIRDTLQQAGIYRPKFKYEHFGGCLVVPVIDPDTGAVLEAYGRKIRPNHKIGKNEMKHGYLPGPHRGVWNAKAFAASDEIILCEALIDAMTFWAHGFRNVTAIYGTSGFSDDLKRAFEQNRIKRVFLAFDRDEAGDRAVEKYAPWFAEVGIEVRRVLFPKGMDANDYALKVQPAAKALDHLLRSAELVSEGRGDTGNGDSETPPNEEAAKEKTGSVVALAAHQAKPILSLAADADKRPRSEVVLERGDHELHLGIGDRSYRVRGFEKNLSYGALKVNLMARCSDLFHVDTLDLYQARQRAAFVHQASVELGQADERIKRDLGQILLKLEALQADQIRKALEVVEPEADEDAELRKAALAWLKSPDLIDNILADFGRLGVVGEDTNVLTGYLAAVSRKLDKPLAVIIQSSSAAGKSALMEAVLTLMPEDERVQYSALTGQSLFYMGETNLKHKILAIAEEEGASNASYALKLLQSEGVITIASTGKDDATGQLVTKEYRVEGPVMLFLTTTAIDIDEELLNRCMVLTVNESRDQTRAIHVMQRQRQTLEGLLAEVDRGAVTGLHRAAQRLLRPLKVVNPYAADLSFADGQTRTRRDHMKYLGLISSIALLHQYSREVKRVEHGARVIEYVEVWPKDIELANKLSSVVLGRTLDELPPQTRKLLIALQDWVRGRADTEDVPVRDIRFRRREAREALGWTDTMLKIHLGRLAELEYLLVHRSAVRGGMSFEYELACDGSELGGLGLKSPFVADAPA